jgi:hypothetical protein
MVDVASERKKKRPTSKVHVPVGYYKALLFLLPCIQRSSKLKTNRGIMHKSFEVGQWLSLECTK